MERNMMWGALGLGCIGWLSALLLAISRRASSGRDLENSRAENAPREVAVRSSFWWLALALPFLIWAATLPTAPPFSSGQGWGRGFLMGGLASLASAWLMVRFPAMRRAAASASLFAALAVASVPLLWMREAVIDALVGAALGWIAVAALLLLGLQSGSNEAEESLDSRLTSLLLLNGAAFAATLCGVAALGVYRDFAVATIARGTYPAVALVVAASVALALLSAAIIGEIPMRPHLAPLFNGLNLLLGLLLPLGMGILLALKILDDLSPVYVIAAGSLLGLLLWWLAWDDAARAHSQVRSGVSAVAVLVALCGFMLAFQILQGFGVGLMLLAAWPASILALPAFAEEKADAESSRAPRFETAQTLSLLLSFVAILLLSRLFATRFRADLRGAGLADQFALFGFVAGVAVPFTLSSLWFSARQTALSRSPARLVGIAILGVALLSAMLTLWGAKVGPAFFAGLGLAALGFHPHFAARTQAAVALFSLAAALLLSQWTHHFAPLAEVSRAQRLHFLLWSVGGLIALILVVELGARLAFGLRGRKTNEQAG